MCEESVGVKPLNEKKWDDLYSGVKIWISFVRLRLLPFLCDDSSLTQEDLVSSVKSTCRAWFIVYLLAPSMLTWRLL